MDWAMNIRRSLKEAIDKPLPKTQDDTCNPDFFNPWGDVIHGIYGDYSSESDDLMIAVLIAVRDGKTFELINRCGFVVEFMLYVLAGHGLTEYGTSPRGGWPNPEIADLWQSLIEKWKGYAVISWSNGGT